MEKKIILLLQMIEQQRTEEAKQYSLALMAKIEAEIDASSTYEYLVRLSKMQKIVENIQKKLNK